MIPRALVNARARPEAVPPPATDAPRFHAGLPGYRPTPLREMPELARELGLESVWLKDESDRFGLPAFKVLGASWAVERALRERPRTTTLVAASAGNHGRAIAHVARQRGLACRVFLPERSLPARREAILGEGAEVVVVPGDYEEAVRRARAHAAAQPGHVEVADVGEGDEAAWVIDGYGTLFAEAAAQAAVDLVVVPVGVGSLAAAAARWAAAAGARVVGVEPATAATLTASLAAGEPTRVPTPGTCMAGLDCAEVSPAAWPTLRDGVTGMITVEDGEVREAVRALAAAGLRIGHCGAAPLVALRTLARDPAAAPLRAAARFDRDARVLLVATEGRTDLPPGAAAATEE